MMKIKLAGLGLASLLMASSLAWGQQEPTSVPVKPVVAESPDTGSGTPASASLQSAETQNESEQDSAVSAGEAGADAPDVSGSGEESTAATTSAKTVEPALKRSPALSGKAGGSLLGVMLALAAVVLMILATAWLIKRFTGFSPLNNRQIKIVASLSIGAREKVVLVEVGGEQLLLGVTPQQINHLHTLKEPVVVSDKPATSDFAQRLQAVLSKSRPNE